MKLLIVYGTTEGHTRTIAESIADTIRATGSEADVVDSAELSEGIQRWRWDATMVGGSVHQGHHQMSLRHFVLHHLIRLNQLPSAFFSVSLSAAVNDPMHQDEACQYLMSFLQETTWQPLETACFAGAVKHGEYDYYRRMVLKLLAGQLAPGIITSHDVVYTDWIKVEAFAKNFLERCQKVSTLHSS